jgi:hypothetical protein
MVGPNCKEVTRLVLMAEDTSLPIRQRLAVRFHMLICKACPKFADQLALMRKASARWRRYTEE